MLAYWRGELIIKRNRKFSNQKKDQTAVHVTISQEGLGEMSHNKTESNTYHTSLQFRKNYHRSLRSAALRFSDTLFEQFFPLVQPVSCKISFIWIAVLRRQVDP